MTQTEFLARLKEDKFHEDPEQHIEYRLPVVQHYLNNLNHQLILNGTKIDFKTLKIIRTSDDFTLINEAFNTLKERHAKGSL